MDSTGKVTVKAEKEEDPEILKLAEEMKEKNKQKMLSTQNQLAQQIQQSRMSMDRAGGQLKITNYYNKDKAENGESEDQIALRRGALDDESVKGRFGFFKMAAHDLPYIFRREDKYVAVKMVETGILNRYLGHLPQEITTCINVRSYFITDNEAKLLHDINSRHCEYQFHKDGYSKSDVIVRVSEAKAFHQFLETCYLKLCIKPVEQSEFCGFVRINGESVVPYTVKEKRKYVPLFYFEGETDTLKLKAEKIDNWELAYLKFCCKVQGIRNELFASDTCAVVSLDDVKQYFPRDTQFEDWWPAKTAEPMRVTPSAPGRTNLGSWITKPAQQPPGRTAPNPQQNGAEKVASAPRQAHHQPRSNQQQPPQAHYQYNNNNQHGAGNGYPKTNQTAQNQHRASKHTSSTATSNASLLNAYQSLINSNPSAANALLGTSNRSANNLMANAAAQNSLLSMYPYMSNNLSGMANYANSTQLQSLVSQLTAAPSNEAALTALLQQQQYNTAAALSGSSRRMQSQHVPTSSASRHSTAGSNSRHSQQLQQQQLQQQQQQQLANYHNLASTYGMESLMAAAGRTPTTYGASATTNSHIRSTRANNKRR